MQFRVILKPPHFWRGVLISQQGKYSAYSKLCRQGSVCMGGFMRISNVDKILAYAKYIVWFGLVLWHINHCRLFNAKSSLDIYIKCI